MCSRERAFQRSKLCQFTKNSPMAGMISSQCISLFCCDFYKSWDLTFTYSFCPRQYSFYITWEGSISLQILVIKCHLMRMGMLYQSMMWWTGCGTQMEAPRLKIWERSKNWRLKSIILSLMKIKSFGILNQKRSDIWRFSVTFFVHYIVVKYSYCN